MAASGVGAFFGHVLPFRLKAAVQQIVVVLPRGVYRDGFPLRVIRYRGDPAASPAMSAVTPIAD